MHLPKTTGTVTKTGLSTRNGIMFVTDLTMYFGEDCGRAGIYNFNFFQNLFLMMLLTHFNLPYSPPLTRGNAEEIYGGSEPV